MSESYPLGLQAAYRDLLDRHLSSSIPRDRRQRHGGAEGRNELLGRPPAHRRPGSRRRISAPTRMRSGSAPTRSGARTRR